MEILDNINEKLVSMNLYGFVINSTRKNKRFTYINPDEALRVHFGDPTATTYLDLLLQNKVNEASKKRKLYRARHSKILNKEGKQAINVKYSPAYLSYNLLW